MYAKTGTTPKYHNALKQGQQLRSDLLELAKSESNESIRFRWEQYLKDAAEHYFLQGSGELITCALLKKEGWTVKETSNSQHVLLIESPEQKTYQLLVIPIESHRDQEMEDQEKQRFITALNNIVSRYRLGIIARRPFLQEYNWNKLCEALSHWVGLATTGLHSFAKWQESSHDIWVEFGISSDQRTENSDLVHFFMHPNQSSFEWENIYNKTQARTSYLDPNIPTLLSIFSPVAFDLSRNLLLRNFYGQIESVSGPPNNRKYSFDQTLVGGFFKDSLPSNVKATLLIQPSYTTDSLPFSCMSFIHPDHISSELPKPCFASSDSNEFCWMPTSTN